MSGACKHLLEVSATYQQDLYCFFRERKSALTAVKAAPVQNRLHNKMVESDA